VDFKVKSIELDGEKYKLSIWVSSAFVYGTRDLKLIIRIQQDRRGSGR
jgi:hypothetical protein